MTQKGSLPSKPSGNSAQAQTIIAIIDACQERTVIPGNGIMVKRSSLGVTLSIDPSKLGGVSSGDSGDARWS